jgi:hypothetical protein
MRAYREYRPTEEQLEDMRRQVGFMREEGPDRGLAGFVRGLRGKLEGETVVGRSAD